MSREVNRYVLFPACVVYGATASYPTKLQEGIYDAPEAVKVYSDYSLEPEQIMSEILDVLQRHKIALGEPLQKARALAFHAAFSDSHSLPLGIKLDKRKAQALVTNVISRFRKTGEPVGIPQMLNVALDISKDNLAEATTYLAVTTRHVARAQDNRLLAIEVNRSLMEKWKEATYCSATYSNLYVDNPAGDIYHFFGGMLIGIAREKSEDTIYGRFTGKICDEICARIPDVTSALRYKIVGHEGGVHGTDILGYETGRALGFAYRP